MCKECNIIKSLFDEASKDAHKNYYAILNFLIALEKQKRIKLYAGDCLFSEAIDVLEVEQHFTVCHYFKCTSCEQDFFLGACIRGTPKYRIINDISKENLASGIWGNIGTKYYI